MIELNLLPEEFKVKKKKGSKIAELPIVPVFLIVIFGLIAAHVLLILTISLNKMNLNRLQKQWDNFSPKGREIAELKKRVKDINDKVKAIEELTEQRVLWAKKLNCLSDCISSNIWLSRLNYDKGSTTPALTLEGYTLGTGEDVGKFMDALERNKDFFEELQSIQLGFTKGSRIENQEVTNFRLIATFKEQKN